MPHMNKQQPTGMFLVELTICRPNVEDHECEIPPPPVKKIVSSE